MLDRKRVCIFAVSLAITLFLIGMASNMMPVTGIDGGSGLQVKLSPYQPAATIIEGPIATDDTYSGIEDTVLQVDAASGVLANDIPGSGLTASLVTGPLHGTLVLNPDGSFIYTPDPNWNGQDTFVYSASDGSSSSKATVTLLFSSVPDVPVAAHDYYSVDEDNTLVVHSPGVLANDYDGDGDVLTAQEVTLPMHGTLKFYQNGSFIYTPVPDWYGVDSFDYEASDGMFFNMATVTITVNYVEKIAVSNLTYTGQFSGTYSDPATLEALLTDSATQLPLEGKSITFVLGDQTYSAVTDSTGIASVTTIINYPAGVYSLSVSYAGDADYRPSSDSVEFTVVKENASIWYTGYTVVSSKLDTMLLRATVFDDADGYWGDMTRINVTFTIYVAGTSPGKGVLILGPYSVAPTDIPGVGVVVIEMPTLPPEAYTVVVSLEPSDNIYYEASSSSDGLIIAEPIRGSVTGGGWIWEGKCSKASFAFEVQYKKNGLLTGKLLYTYREGNWFYLIKSHVLTGLYIEDNYATFEGLCAVYRFQLKAKSFEYLGSDFLFRVEVWDVRKNDVFQMHVLDGNGLVFHEAGVEPYGALHGSIQIHTHHAWSYCHCHRQKMVKMHRCHTFRYR